MDEASNISKNTILESLSLTPALPESVKNEEIKLPCMFCDYTENHQLNKENKAILKHMFNEHRLVIADVQEVSELSEYLKFWKKEFSG